MLIAVFLIITFGFSWGVFALAYMHGLFHAGVGPSEVPVLAVIMAGPAIAGVALSLATRRQMPIRERLGLRFRPNLWWLLAWALPAALCFAAVPLTGLAGYAVQGPHAAGEKLIAMTRAAGGHAPPIDATQVYYILAGVALIPGAFVNMFGTLLEELGWRGFLWSKLRPGGFWRTNLIIGVIWGIWHAPVIYTGFNYPGMGWRGVLMFILFCLLLAPIVGLMRELGRSVLAAGLTHGTFNAVAGVSLMLLGNVPPFWNGILGWVGIALLFAVDLVILLAYRPIARE